jgi:hypothetical protein
MKLSAAIAGFIGSMALLLGEILILIRLGWIRECDMYLSLIPALYFLFYISLNIKMKESPIYIKIRYVSMVTYFIHVWVLAIIYEMFVVMGVTWLNYGMLLVLAMIASVGVSALIVYLSNAEKGEFLKRLYR